MTMERSYSGWTFNFNLMSVDEISSLSVCVLLTESISAFPLKEQVIASQGNYS